MKQKVFAFNEIKKLKNLLKDKKVVLVGGCFDIFHFGHLMFLEKAKEQGDYLIVALESDKFINLSKHRGVIHTQEQRAEILTELNCVDAVILLPYFIKRDEEYFKMTQVIRPAIIAITSGDKKIEKKKKQAYKVGGKVIKVNTLINNLSTSQILKILNSQL